MFDIFLSPILATRDTNYIRFGQTTSLTLHSYVYMYFVIIHLVIIPTEYNQYAFIKATEMTIRNMSNDIAFCPMSFKRYSRELYIDDMLH